MPNLVDHIALDIPDYPELVMKKVDVDANPVFAQVTEIEAMPTFKVGTIYHNVTSVESLVIRMIAHIWLEDQGVVVGMSVVFGLDVRA